VNRLVDAAKALVDPSAQATATEEHIRPAFMQNVALAVHTLWEVYRGEVPPPTAAEGDPAASNANANVNSANVNLMASSSTSSLSSTSTMGHVSQTASGGAVAECRVTVLIDTAPHHPSDNDDSNSNANHANNSDHVPQQPVGWDIHAHASLLPAPPQGTVNVELRGEPRDMPGVKDSQWLRDRAVFEQALASDCNEYLLAKHGEILEGGSSNFFAIDHDGVLHTADDGVLPGTMRAVALQAAQLVGLTVKLDAPPADRAALSTWREGFITSTSRVLLPIGEVRFPLTEEPPLVMPATKQSERVREAMLGSMQEQSTVLPRPQCLPPQSSLQRVHFNKN